jgi:3-dehydroquinate synthase
LSKSALNLPAAFVREYVEYIARIYKKIDIKLSDFDELYELMLHDKKNHSQIIRFALLRTEGLVDISVQCSKDIIYQAFLDYLELISTIE